MRWGVPGRGELNCRTALLLKCSENIFVANASEPWFRPCRQWTAQAVVKVPAGCQQRAGVQGLQSFSFVQILSVHYFYCHDSLLCFFIFSFVFGFWLIASWLLWEMFFHCAKSVFGWPCRGGAVRAPLAPSAGAAGAAQGEHSGPRALRAGSPSRLWAGNSTPAVVAAPKESRCCCSFCREAKCSKWQLCLHTARVSISQSSLQWCHRHTPPHTPPAPGLGVA